MPDGLRTLLLDPAMVLSLIVGAFHACIYLVLSGRLGLHILAVLLASIVGAIAGQALGSRVGDLLTLGDYPLLWASAFAWLGIGLIVAASRLGPDGTGPPREGRVRPRHRDS